MGGRGTHMQTVSREINRCFPPAITKLAKVSMIICW